jgi:GTP-binding protein
MNAEFLLSTLTEFPEKKSPQGALLPELALAGRSNVGKSSLINNLLSRKRLARVSSTPGKTQLLNFFLIDDAFLLVDLPGYGFAKAPPEEQEKWSLAIDFYMQNRKTLGLILLLVDSRRDFNQQDLSLIRWSEKKKIPLLLIFTKTDKLSKHEKMALSKKYPEAILYTTEELGPRIVLEKKIKEILHVK